MNSNKPYNFDDNPWAGSSSYQDPENSDTRLKFCGRDNEIYDVSQLVDDNIFVTLYGKSGTGKTSLLNAGVFPRLRDMGYMPVRIRLGTDAEGYSFQQCVITKTIETFRGKGEMRVIDVVDMPKDEYAPEYLWSYFARTRFSDSNGNSVFPVIVLDQFEEVFRSRRDDTEVLLRQIYFMMDESHELTDRVIDGVLYSYDFNFRFVVSIREDELYRLEDSIDNNYLPNMKLCRFRLRNLSDEGARDAILTPGEGLFNNDEKEQIANAIMAIARNKEDRSISTIILSLTCSSIFIEYKRAGLSYITFSLVEKFVKGNPFVRFYNEATKGFSNREKTYIETNLVDSSNRRNSIPEDDLKNHVKNWKLLLDGDKRILQRISSSSDDNYRVELVHDSFCDPLNGLKAKREKRRKMKWYGSALFISLFSIAIGLFMIYQNIQLRKSYMAIDQLKLSEIELGETKRQLGDIKKDKAIADEKIKDVKRAKEEADEKIKQAELAKEEADLKLRKAQYATEDAEKKLHAAEMAITETEKQLRAKEDELARKEEELARLNADKEKEVNDSSRSSVQSLEGLGFSVDDIAFSYDYPTLDQMEKWKNKFSSICKEKIADKIDRFDISKEMIEEDPCLVYLILNSRSLETKADKQEWLNLYSLMNQEQKQKLYDILYREAYKLAQIEDKYAKKQEEINKKYKKVNKEQNK